MAKEKNIEKEIAAIEKEIEETKKPTNGPDPFEKVILNIPISMEDPQDWLCVVNGHYYRVQKGKDVLVPRFVKELYDNEQRQKNEAIEKSQKLQRAAADQLAFH